MRETLKEWKKDWIEANGETNELEVVISNLDEPVSCVYEGSFKDIPEELLDEKVIEYGRIIASTVVKRVGAYSLKI